MHNQLDGYALVTLICARGSFRIRGYPIMECVIDTLAIYCEGNLGANGRPLDLGNSLAYWIEACDPQDLKEGMPTVTDAPGFMTRRVLMERYAHRSGRDLSKVRFYVTFGYFRLAVALQQIYARWKRGQTKDERFADFGKKVHTLVLHASELAASGRI